MALPSFEFERLLLPKDHAYVFVWNNDFVDEWLATTEECHPHFQALFRDLQTLLAKVLDELPSKANEPHPSPRGSTDYMVHCSEPNHNCPVTTCGRHRLWKKSPSAVQKKKPYRKIK